MIRCANHVLCGNAAAAPGARCLACRMFDLRDVREAAPREPCAVCAAEDGAFVAFPARCGHVFCAACVRDLVFYSEPPVEHLSPAAFGGPACPNGCANPAAGPQCRCPEHAEAVLRWCNADFGAYSAWLARTAAERGRSAAASARGSRVCPLCRAKVPLPRNVPEMLRREILGVL